VIFFIGKKSSNIPFKAKAEPETRLVEGSRARWNYQEKQNPIIRVEFAFHGGLLLLLLMTIKTSVLFFNSEALLKKNFGIGKNILGLHSTKRSF
jgi:hypothetical protein